MEFSDQQLVEQCAAGDTSAFEQLVARYQTLVCSVAYSITGDFEKSEDVGQDTFVAAWRQLAELNDASRFKSWICSITRNLAHNAMRRDRKMRFGEFSEPLADSGPPPDDEASRHEEEALVWTALSRVPENYREPLVLFYRQDQSVAEVAQALDISADLAKQRLSRGRKMLRDEVLSAIERTLKRTTPARAFTLAVLAALPSLASKTAAAAGAGSITAAAKAFGTGAAPASGIVGSALGTLVGVGGGAFGTWASWSTAQFQSQRDLIRRGTIAYVVGMTIFMLPFAAMMFGWRPHKALGSNGYLIAYGVWMAVFMTANFVWMFRTIRQWKLITNRDQAIGASRLPTTPVRRWIEKWEGRRWTSRRTLLGWPLVDIAFSDPGGYVFGEQRRTQGTARGWIAIGDYARGRLLAIGNVAVAPVAIGTLSVGIVSMGVLSVGLFTFGVISIAVVALGVMALGVWSFGGAAAVGYLAAAPLAIGWEAAHGAVALASNYADGAKAMAEHAGDAAAKEYFASSRFFQLTGDWLARMVAVSPSLRRPWILLFLLMLMYAFWRAAYRRKAL